MHVQWPPGLQAITVTCPLKGASGPAAPVMYLSVTPRGQLGPKQTNMWRMLQRAWVLDLTCSFPGKEYQEGQSKMAQLDAAARGAAPLGACTLHLRQRRPRLQRTPEIHTREYTCRGPHSVSTLATGCFPTSVTAAT